MSEIAKALSRPPTCELWLLMNSSSFAFYYNGFQKPSIAMLAEPTCTGCVQALIIKRLRTNLETTVSC